MSEAFRSIFCFFGGNNCRCTGGKCNKIKPQPDAIVENCRGEGGESAHKIAHIEDVSGSSGVLEFLQQLDAKATKLTSHHGDESPQGHPGGGQGQTQDAEGQKTSDDDATAEMETVIQNLQEKKRQLKQKLCSGPKQVFGTLDNKKLRRFKARTAADRSCMRRATDYIKQRKAEELKKAYSLAGISMTRVSESCVRVTWGTCYAGQYRDSYQAEIHVSHSLKIGHHNLPASLPLEELSSAHLNSDLKQFLWVVGDHLNYLVSRS